MELVLIIIGGVLATAIIFMIIDRIRGEPFGEDDDPFDHTGYEDPVITPELRARLRDEGVGSKSSTDGLERSA